MAVKYHVSKTAGPVVCRAKIKCRISGPEEHFDNKKDAQEYFEKQLSENNPLSSIKKKKLSINTNPKLAHNEFSKGQVFNSYVKDKKFTPELFELDEELEDKDFDSLQFFADSSKENFDKMDELIDARSAHAYKTSVEIEKMNPKNSEKGNKVSMKTLTVLKRDLGSYRNQTAMMVEAHLNSKFYKPKYEEYDPKADLGAAKLATSYSHSDPQWHFSRYNSIGGSDVGALVMSDYMKKEDMKSLDRLYVNKIISSKTTPPTSETAAKSIAMSETSRKGALYIGTIWEDRIRDDFAKDHPEYKVYNAKQQYEAEDKSWYKINVDGVLSDRKDGKPNGILEIKSGSDLEKWKNGVPANYRAQVLYYLNATKMDYAVVRASLLDAEVKDYRFNRDDEVYPGSGVTMSEYVSNRVEPWFEEIKNNRA